MVDHAKINSRLTLMLFPYDKRLDSLHGIIAGIILGSLVLFFCVFKWGFDYSIGKTMLRTLIAGLGAFVGCVVVDSIVLSMIVGSARRRFDREFPMNTARRKMAIRVLNELNSESKIEEDLLRSLPENSFHYGDQTDSPPEHQLQSSLNQVLSEKESPHEVPQQGEIGPEQQTPRKQILKQPINHYRHIPLQTTKKVMLKTHEQKDDERSVMLDPESPPRCAKKQHDKRN